MSDTYFPALGKEIKDLEAENVKCRALLVSTTEQLKRTVLRLEQENVKLLNNDKSLIFNRVNLRKELKGLHLPDIKHVWIRFWLI